MKNPSPSHILVSSQNVKRNLDAAQREFERIEKADSIRDVTNATRKVMDHLECALRNLSTLLPAPKPVPTATE